MNANIAIMGASYLQLPLIKKAKELGYVTHVFAWEVGDVGETEADFFYPISIVQWQQILEVCQSLKIAGVCSIASDLAAVTVNRVAVALGLTCNSSESVLKSTNKYLMRKAFWENNDPSPFSILLPKDSCLANLNITYPCIVKPTDRSGSRGVYKVENERELLNAIDCAREQSFLGEVLVEEFIYGVEYSVEYISYQGKHFFLALTEKTTTGAPCFIEIKHTEPIELDEDVMKKIKDIVSHALDSLEIENGASHSEIIIEANGSIRIIEIGARMGGDCIGSHLVKYSTGYDYVRMVIQVACGQAPDFTKICSPQKVESVFLLTEEDILRMQSLQNDSPNSIIEIVDFHPENIGSTTDSSNRSGCYIRKV